MRENKEKTVTSGDEDIAVLPVVPITSVQVGKRKSKSISSVVDLDNLPSRQGAKKQKPVKTSIPKVPKFTPLTVNLDDPLVDVEPIQTVHPIQTDLPPPPVKNSRKPSLSEPSVLLIWCWTRTTHGGRSKESSLIKKSMKATTCQ